MSVSIDTGKVMRTDPTLSEGFEDACQRLLNVEVNGCKSGLQCCARHSQRILNRVGRAT